MSKKGLNVRIDDGEFSSLDTIAKGRGITVSKLVRGIIDRELAELAEPVSLEILFEQRAKIDQRIEEARIIAELRANAKPPDLVLVDVAGRSGVKMQVERAQAIAAGVPFEEKA